MASANDIIETPTRIEPARLEETPEAIADAIAALSSASAALGARLHPATAANLSDLVRLMNCYYSNLIEGHNTRPRDIARALVADLDRDEGRRNLQIEAAAHVRVQEKTDRLAAEDRLPERTARRVLGDVVDAGLLASATPKGPVSLRFPVDTLGGLFPRFYPDT